ncbi:MAG: ATP-binding protein [Clostridia bacterium]|nr:ATP-binding protein [Clostridia bacterium]
MKTYVQELRAKQQANFKMNEGDYIDPQSGLCICGKCKNPRQTQVEMFGKMETVSCECKCDEIEKAEKAKKEKAENIRRNKIEAFGGKYAVRGEYTFENDDQPASIASQVAKKYVEYFPENRMRGEGLLLYSPLTGGGKTFLACAVANALIEAGFLGRVTSFAELADEMAYKNRFDVLSDLYDLDFIVIDDLGAENTNQFVISAEHRIIEELTDRNIPFIFTTNYTPKEMAEIEDRAKHRIFDRVLGKSYGVRIDPPEGKSRRVTNFLRLTNEIKNEL